MCLSHRFHYTNYAGERVAAQINYFLFKTNTQVAVTSQIHIGCISVSPTKPFNESATFKTLIPPTRVFAGTRAQRNRAQQTQITIIIVPFNFACVGSAHSIVVCYYLLCFFTKFIAFGRHMCQLVECK